MENLFIREIERNDGRILAISQCEVGDVGCVVWDAALVLTKYLETEDFNDGENLNNLRIVELGSGTGVVGLMAASYGFSGNRGSHSVMSLCIAKPQAKVIITDLQEFVPLMEMNVNNNKHLFRNPVKAQALKWGEKIQDKEMFGEIDVLLIADCIYYEESLEPLVKTIADLSTGTTCVYCCYEERTTGNKPELQRKFFCLINQHFLVEEVPLHRQDAHYRSEDIHIMKFTKLKE